jgi:hypothetical protein
MSRIGLPRICISFTLYNRVNSWSSLPLFYTSAIGEDNPQRMNFHICFQSNGLHQLSLATIPGAGTIAGDCPVRATSHRIAGLIQGVMVSGHEIRMWTSRRSQRVAHGLGKTTLKLLPRTRMTTVSSCERASVSKFRVMFHII